MNKKITIKKLIYFVAILIASGLMMWGIFAPRVGDPPGFHKQREIDFYEKYGKSKTGRNCTIVEIDGCEYIEFETSVGYHGLTHKGNLQESNSLSKS